MTFLIELFIKFNLNINLLRTIYQHTLFTFKVTVLKLSKDFHGKFEAKIICAKNLAFRNCQQLIFKPFLKKKINNLLIS